MRSVQSTLFALLVASGAASANMQLNLTQGVSPISHDVYELHMTVFWICVVIGIIVFGAMTYAMIFHRKSKGAIPAQFHSHPFLEIGWTIVPALILVLLAIPATKVLINMNNEAQEELTIKITGYQWKWHYEYLEEGVSFFSNLSTPLDQLRNLAPKGEHYLREVDNPIVIPIHKKIRFLITSNDVNHAWWVPDFGIKKDAISGFINEAWTIVDKPGTYRGQCAELCGINHAFMPIVVVATTFQGYKDFIAKQKGQATQGEAELNKQWTMQELMAQGEKVYARVCAACHQPAGTGLPPTFPALKGSKVALGPIEKHIETVMNGVSGTAMQAFKTQLSDAELAAIITYERNAFGNNTNSSIQPIQIKAVREGKAVSEALTIKPSGIVPAPSANAAPAPQQPAAGLAPANAAQAAPSAGTPAPATTPAPGAQPAPSAPAAKAAVSSAGAVITINPPVNETTTITITTSPSAPVSSAPAQTPTPSVPSTQAPASTTAAPKAVPTAAPSAPAAAEDLKAVMERGEKVYLTRCALCHQPAGTGLPPTFPSLKSSAIVAGPALEHLKLVVNGKQGTAMQAFKEQLSDQEIADVVTYERNAFGSDKGKLVKPEDVKAAHEPK